MRNNVTLTFKSFIKFILIICLSVLLYSRINAQACDTFYNAESINQLAGLLNPYYVDIDNDGDLDCYIRKYNDYYGEYAVPSLYRNIGTKSAPIFVEDSVSGFAQNDSFFSWESCQFVDIDGDGDYDYFVGEDAHNRIDDPYGLKIHFYKNIGTKQKPQFIEDETDNPVWFISGYYYDEFTFADMDNDGDYDLYTWDELHKSVYYNTGTAIAPAYTLHAQTKATGLLDRTYYDWNKDGLTDYFERTSNEGNLTNYYKNVGKQGAPKYVLDNTSGPAFKAGAPFQFIDLNDDAILEMTDAYDMLNSPVNVYPVISAKKITMGVQTFYKLTASPILPNFTYQWKRNGKNIPGAVKTYLVASAQGYYTLSVIGNCGAAFSKPYKIDTLTTRNETNLGMNAITNTTLIKMYPNPFLRQFTLQLPPSKTLNSKLVIYDAQGRILEARQINSSVITAGENLPAGIYIIKLLQNNSVILTEKLIKQ